MTLRSERGIALITSMLILMLMSALLIGFTAVVVSDQRYRFIDRDRSQAFYGASAGVEKLTADLGNLFLANVAPTSSQIASLVTTTKMPSLTGVTYTSTAAPAALPTSTLTRCVSPSVPTTSGSNGYAISFCAAANGNPTTSSITPIISGPYAGLIAEQTPYQIDVTARTSTGGESHLVRQVESVAIPVFQFGIFSDVDLGFHAGPNFNFGGRVHTNANLYLAEGTGSTLTLADKVTAVREVVRQRLENGVTTAVSGHTGTVKMASSVGVYRALLPTEGSVVDDVNSALNEPTWHTTSLSTYNSWIRNGRTGAKSLNLALITVGGSNPDLVRRPVPNEDTTNALLFGERLFTKASLRVLLSDTAADITGLPTVTATAPVQLDGNWRTTPPNNGTAYGPVDATHPPIARSPGTTTATINTGAALGTAQTLTITAGVPAYFKVPDTLTVTKTGTGAGTWTLTGCSGSRTLTTFTCTNTPSPSHGGTTTAAGATVSGVVATPDGNITETTTTTANWVNNGSTLTVTSTLAFAPESFWVGDTLLSCTGYGATTLTNCNLPVAIANNSTLTTAALSTAGTGTIGGYLKIERGNTNGTWTDVTMEILNYGIGGANLAGVACNDPTPNAILKVERLRDNALQTGTACPYSGSVTSASVDYWPNVLFDTREALQRDTSPGTSVVLGGVMYYIGVDAANLAKWFKGTSPYNGGTGNLSKTDNGGFTLYFSDRRNNRNSSGNETGEYGWEDFVNPSIATGAPNGTLDAGEDVNANGTLDVYGGIPNYNGTYNSAPPGAAAPLDTTARPTTAITRGVAQGNRPILFRHALKLVNGAAIAATGVTGLTVVSENPVYVQGDWNATGGAFTGTHAATAVIADAVTLLSNAWTDDVSFDFPYTPGSRNRGSQTWYRLAIISGKGMPFPNPNGTTTDFGSDGGAHNFLRYLENGDQPVNYLGSMATFYYNRQALGTYKCCNTVYTAPTRNYTFDTDFLTPALLPPNTPVFRDMNAVGFAQELRPGK